MITERRGGMDATNIMEPFVQYADKARSWVAHEFGLQVADAEDIVQEVLLRLGRSRPLEVRNPKAYLFKACARAAWRHSQRLKKWRMVHIACADHCLTPRVREDRAESNNPRLSKISRRHRRLAHLIASGFSQVQAARELNLKPNTVRVYVHEMRKSLARMAA